jgi:hypothetical protein
MAAASTAKKLIFFHFSCLFWRVVYADNLERIVYLQHGNVAVPVENILLAFGLAVVCELTHA